MKRTSILLLLTLLSLGVIAQTPRLAVSRCSQVVLPASVDRLSFSNDLLYLHIPGLLLSSHQLGGHLQPPEGDITTRSLGDDVNYVVRHPVSGHRFFTTPAGRCYQEVPRTDKEPKVLRVSLPRFSGTIVTPVFSADGRWMLFASDARGGRGGLDLWAVCTDSLGEWLEPLHLDATVNSINDELSPVLVENFLLFTGSAPRSQNQALFGCPIRLVPPSESLPQGAVFTGTAQPLPNPINSPVGSNRSLVVNADASKGYWISTRDGEERLYQFAGNLRSSHVWGVVADSNGNPLKDVRVTLRHQGRTVDTARTLADGSYGIFLQFGRPYDLYFSLRDYFTSHLPISVPSQGDDRLFNDLRHDVTLGRLQYDTTFYLYDVFGNDAEEELSAEGCRSIEPLVRFLRENPHVVAAISLRTDLTRDAAYNRLLGQHRINALKGYIASLVAQPNIVYYNDCDYGEGCHSGANNAILAIVLRSPDRK